LIIYPIALKIILMDFNHGMTRYGIGQTVMRKERKELRNESSSGAYKDMKMFVFQDVAPSP
jgi:hypothetical protein